MILAQYVWRRRPRTEGCRTREGLLRCAASACIGLTALAAAPARAQQYTLVSKAAHGTLGDGNSRSGMISADSSWVAFASAATNLVANDTNAKWDVFVKNPQTQAIARVSVATDGSERTDDSGLDGLDVNQDGQIVVFSSSATLVEADTNSCTLEAGGTGACPDIYVRDRSANTTTRISVATGGAQADRRSRHPRISDDGRYVAFSSFATNLVGGDTNGVEDVFLHDRQTGTTTRVSVTTDGAQVDMASFNAEISGNSASIAFLSAAAGFSSAPDPLACPTTPSIPCLRAFVHDRASGATTAVRVGGGHPSLPAEGQATDLAIDRQGRFVAVGVSQPNDTEFHWFSVLLYDRGQQQTVRTLDSLPASAQDVGPFGVPSLGAALSGDGQVVMHGGGLGGALSGGGQVVMHGGGLEILKFLSIFYSFSVFDRHTGVFEPSRASPTADAAVFFDPELSTDGRQVVVTIGAQRVPEDTNAFQDVYIFSRDVDNDGMADAWESTFRLDPTAAGDATLDPDSDGRTNLQEYQAGTHPTATMTRYFAEGASNPFFRTRIALLNTTTSATVVLRYLGSDGVSASTHFVQGQSRVTFDLGPGSNLPSGDFSTIIESDQAIVADRTMTWDATGYGAHAETAIEAPALNWFLAEGATHGRFDLFYLLQNPNATETTATITYLRPSPQAPLSKAYTLGANSRRTIWVDTEDTALADTDVSAQIAATQPIIVERAMYATLPGQPPFAAGHEGAGVTAPANSWFLAEGATGDFFDLYVLVANPGAADANATVTYLLPDVPSFTKSYVVPGQSRLTISVDGEDPRLAGTAVAVKVDSTLPVVVERAMWWPSPNWYEGHLASATTTTGTQWALAEGEVGVNSTTGADTETYILIANTADTAGSATLTLFHEAPVTGPVTSQLTVPLPPSSRVTVAVGSSFPAGDFAPSRRFGAVVQSTGAPIVVERAMYTSVNGLFWSAGTSSVATKLQ